MINNKNRYISLFLVSILSLGGLSACSSSDSGDSELNAGNERLDTDTNVSSGSSKDNDSNDNNEEQNSSSTNDKSNTEESSDNSTVLGSKEEKIVNTANDFYNDLISFDFPDTPENRDDANYRQTYAQVEELLGAPVFTNPDYAYDVRISLNDLDQELVSNVNNVLEQEYNSSKNTTNYSNLALAEKLIYNTYLGILKKELSLYDVDSVSVNADNIEFDENGDAIIPVKDNMFGDSNFSTVPIRLYENKNGDWIVDAVDFISIFFSPNPA